MTCVYVCICHQGKYTHKLASGLMYIVQYGPNMIGLTGYTDFIMAVVIIIVSIGVALETKCIMVDNLNVHKAKLALYS